VLPGKEGQPAVLLLVIEHGLDGVHLQPQHLQGEPAQQANFVQVTDLVVAQAQLEQGLSTGLCNDDGQGVVGGEAREGKVGVGERREREEKMVGGRKKKGKEKRKERSVMKGTSRLGIKREGIKREDQEVKDFDRADCVRKRGGLWRRQEKKGG